MKRLRWWEVLLLVLGAAYCITVAVYVFTHPAEVRPLLERLS